MGDLINFVEFKQRKENEKRVYTSYTEWITYEVLAKRATTGRGISRYDLAVNEQQHGNLSWFMYFYPDFDW